MKDRIPGRPGRVKITLDDKTEIEGVLSLADDPEVEGSLYNKGNVLPDDICHMIGIDSETSEPKDAFDRMQTKWLAKIGDVVLASQFRVPALPSNFIYCDGRNLSRSSYPDLFNVIGYASGGGLSFTDSGLTVYYGHPEGALMDNGNGLLQINTNSNSSYRSIYACKNGTVTSIKSGDDASNSRVAAGKSVVAIFLAGKLTVYDDKLSEKYTVDTKITEQVCYLQIVDERVFIYCVTSSPDTGHVYMQSKSDHAVFEKITAADPNGYGANVIRNAITNKRIQYVFGSFFIAVSDSGNVHVLKSDDLATYTVAFSAQFDKPPYLVSISEKVLFLSGLAGGKVMLSTDGTSFVQANRSLRKGDEAVNSATLALDDNLLYVFTSSAIVVYNIVAKKCIGEIVLPSEYDSTSYVNTSDSRDPFPRASIHVSWALAGSTRPHKMYM